MQRSNLVPCLHLAGWLVLLAMTGCLVWMTADTWWWPVALFTHGIVLVHHFSLQHECTHYTAFRHRRLNDAVGAICGFVIMLGPTFFRYEHCDHHTWTHRTGQDPEQILLPQTVWGYVLYISSMPYWWTKFLEITRHGVGRLTDTEKRFIPVVARPRVYLEARVMLTLYVALVVASASLQRTELFWYWVLPVLLGEPVMRAIRMTEHVGMPAISDMRRNTRTNLVWAPLQWLCWNMNFHAEHHYASSVPYHALPRLHRMLNGYLTVERNGYMGAHRDILAQIRGTKPRVDATPPANP
jgi:fatty acid desaturase